MSTTKEKIAALESEVKNVTDRLNAPMPAMDVCAKAEPPDPRIVAKELARLEALYVMLDGHWFNGVHEFRAALGAQITACRLGGGRSF